MSPCAAQNSRPPDPETPAPQTTAIDGIRVEFFGVGNVVRPGDWAGLRLALTTAGETPRTVAARLHIDDADGDTVLHSRLVTLNPGLESGVWLYARMPWSIAQGSVVRASIAEASADARGEMLIGKQLAWAPIAASKVISEADALALVVGNNPLGLDQFKGVVRTLDGIPPAHETLQVVSQITPELLPDQWQGLGAYEVVLWQSGDPSAIPGEAPPRALREWVHRGGHLVVVLPGVGNAWTSPSNPLASLLPTCQIERLPEADLAPYRTFLSGVAVPFPRSITLPLHRFIIDDATEPRDATPIITGPHGVIAARRLVGAGMVTLIGLDLSNPVITSGGFIRGDALWPRILGRRGATPTTSELDAARSRATGRLRPTEVFADERISAFIARGRAASIGILLGLLVFSAYLLIAGPVGFAILKFKGWQRHAWVAFVGVAIAFTAFAWAGAQALRPKLDQAWHFTILDHVYGQPVQRARSFVSVLLTRYGNQRVRLGTPGTDESFNQALSAWIDPLTDVRADFPDSRAYASDVRRMFELIAPARSTIKTFQADWVGGPRWSMPVPVTPERAPRLDSSGRLVGALKHGLPAPLENLHIMLVSGPTAEFVSNPAESPRLIARAYAWILPDAWAPGTPLDLAVFQPTADALAEQRFRDLVPEMSLINRALPVSIKDEDLDDMIAFYNVLEQPDIDADTAGLSVIPAIVQRRLVHTFDLSKWFTQPCLIIIGRIAEAPNPVPMSVDDRALDGRELPSSGRTIVRWIYPLSPRPHVVGRLIPPRSVPPSAAPTDQRGDS